MGNPAPKKATYSDLCAVPSNQVAEIIGGTLYTQPRPASRHALASSGIGGELFSSFHRGKRGPGGWVISFEPELHLGEDVMVPDLAGWRRSTMPEMPDTAYFETTPDWVCEVLSPSTEKTDRAEKMPRYQAAGCGHVWLVQPDTKSLEIYRLDGPSYRLVSIETDDATIHPEPFGAVPFDLGALWAR